MKRSSFKKVVSIILVIVCVFTLSGVSNAKDDSEVKMNKQSEKLKEFDKVLKHIEKKYSEDNDFGGSYFDIDDQLVINITEPSYDRILASLAKDNIDMSKIKFKKVKYSLSENYDTINQLIAQPAELNIVSVRLDESVGKIVVTVESLSEEIGKKLSKLSKEDQLIIIESTNNFEVSFTSTDVVLGTRYKSSAYGSYLGSFGFSVEDSSGDKGWIIPGHTSIPVGGGIYYGITKIGEVKAKSLGGTVDAAFVERTNSNYLCVWSTPNVDSYYLVTPASYTYPQNADIFMNGGISGKKYGDIISNSYTTQVEGIWMTYVQADYSSQSGDSGSPIGRNSTLYPSDPDKRILIGIQSGTGGGYSFFTKANDNFDDLDVTGYTD